MKNTKRRSMSSKISKMTKRKLYGGRKNSMKQTIKDLKSIGMKRLQCSPLRKKNKNDFSCFSSEDLYKLRDLWNMRHPDALIKTNEPKEIWSALKNYMGSVCNKESCWLKQNFVGNEKIKKELEDAFAPKSPNEWKKNPNEWLSSVDILDVMKQYEEVYPEFKFYGTNPIDFSAPDPYNPSAAAKNKCLQDEICKLNLNKKLISKNL
jgi:hypothetical protein